MWGTNMCPPLPNPSHQVHNTLLLDGLLAAHAAAVTSTEGMRASCSASTTAASMAGSMDGAAHHAHPLVAARHLLAQALAAWMRKEWSPVAVGVLLGRRPQYSGAAEGVDRLLRELHTAIGRPALPAAAPLPAPAQVYAAVVALGDLLPGEWPGWPAPGGGGASAPAAALAPPSHRQLRKLVGDAIAATCVEQLAAAITFCVGSEARLLRCALVRLCAKAAGIGAGMGPFLARPLLEELQHITKAGAAAAAGAGMAAGGGGGAAAAAAQLVEARRVLEVLAPLAWLPVMKVRGH